MAFVQPITGADVAALRGRLLQLPEGTCLSCRGRESITDNWDYGRCVKRGDRLDFAYQSGDAETLRINRINFRQLIEVELDDEPSCPAGLAPEDHGEGFLTASSGDDVAALREYLLQQTDGSSFSCRGRDRRSDPWSYGQCVKHGDQLFFAYEDGDNERLAISRINFKSLVQLQIDSDRIHSGDQLCQSDSVNGKDASEATLPVFLEVNPDTVSTGWPAADSPEASFFRPDDDAVVNCLRAHLHGLADGMGLYCRGRDSLCSKWDYGYCVKNGTQLRFFYSSGDREALSIDRIKFKTLIHIAVATSRQRDIPLMRASSAVRGVAVIAHGYSPETGPDYRLINVLARAAVDRGFRVVVPDFRCTYAFENRGKGRDERIRMLKAEILRLAGAPVIALVGHSQGGRATANVCTDSEITALPVRGCLMYGSEDPAELGSRRPLPHMPNNSVRIVHAAGDGVISIGALRKRAALWSVPFDELHSDIAGKSAKDVWGDDVNHDFLAADLLPRAVDIYKAFLDDCVGMVTD